MQLSIDTETSLRFAMALRAGRGTRREGPGGNGGHGRREQRSELAPLLATSGFRAYLAHLRGDDGAPGDGGHFLEDVEDFWTGESPQRHSAWDALTGLSSTTIEQRHGDLRCSLTPEAIASLVLPWVDAGGCFLELALIVDPRCPSVSLGTIALIDVLDYWRGELDQGGMLDRAAAAVYRSAAAAVFRRSFEIRGSFRGWGEIAAVVLLHRIVTTGIVCREFPARPRRIPPAPAAETAWLCAPHVEPVAWLRRTLDSLRAGAVDAASASAMLRQLDHGSPSPAAVIGAGLLESVALSPGSARAWARDPRSFPLELTRHGFPEDLASWCARIGEEPRIDTLGTEDTGAAWGGVRVISLPCGETGFEAGSAGGAVYQATTIAIAVAAGGIHDPIGCEGLAHLTEHLLHDRLAQARFPGVSVLAFLEKEVALYLIRLEGRTRPALADLLRCILDPLDAHADRIGRAQGEIETEIHRNTSDTLGAIEVAVERDLLGPPYGRPLTGSLRSLPRLTRERIQSFHRRCYRPGRAVAAVIGPALEAAGSAGSIHSPRPFVPVRAKGRRAVWAWRAHPGGGFWVLARAVPGKDDPSFRSVAVLGRIVAGLLRDRFEDRVRLGSSFFVGKGIWRFVARRDAAVTPADLVSFLHREVRGVSEANLHAASLAEGAAYAALAVRADCCSLWLAAGGLLVPERRVSIEGERSAYDVLDPAEIQALGERLLARPAIPGIPS